MRNIIKNGIESLLKLKITYGDIRIGSYRKRNLVVRNLIPTNFSDDESEGVGVRVFVDGFWGFCSSSVISEESIQNCAHRAREIAQASARGNGSKLCLTPVEPHDIVWKVAYSIDPFTVPVNEQIQLLAAINEKVLHGKDIKQSVSTMTFQKEHKYFSSTVGTFTDQLLLRSHCEYTATAINKNGFETRTFQDKPLNEGYEHINPEFLLNSASRIAEEAREKLLAPLCPQDHFDLVLLPNHTALVIHETIGHPTELDRVLGWEADFAGTSFAKTEKLGTLKYGSDIFSVIGDRTQEKGRATVPFDDDGCPTKKWYMIKNGILNDYATTRDTAPFIGSNDSNACSFADSWNSMPILRMPNVSIEAGRDGAPKLADIIASTDKGILIDGRGSYSIDHQRINFQFGGDYCRRIEKGKVGEVLRRVTYQSHNPLFWNSVDVIAPADEWEQYGVTNCGKGQPMQVAQLTHGSSPMRVRNVPVGRARL